MSKKKNIDMLTTYFGGISGLLVPVPKYLFPEAHKDSSRLTYYSTFFNSIEINSTFYKLPLTKTISKWAEQVPETFKFTFKLWQEVSHAKNLDFKEEDVTSFFKAIDGAGSKKGCVLIQFPPSIGSAYIRQLDFLLKCVAQNNLENEWKIAVEFRNRSWYVKEVYDLLESYNAALVLQDIPKSKSPVITSTSDFIYLRFHGPSGNYKDSYSDAFLSEQSFFINECLNEGKTVYVYFNNTMGDAFKNLESLNDFIYGFEH